MTAVVAAAALAVSAFTQQIPYDSVFDQLKSVAPLPTFAPVKNVVLRRDAMELRLESGTAWLLTPLRGRTIGIAFVGTATLTFEPPLLVDRYNLRRVLSDSSGSGPVTAAAFIFADSTAEELKRQLAFGSQPGTPFGSGDVQDAAKNALEYLIDDRSHSANPSLMSALLNNQTTGYFAAYIKRARGESVMIEFDPLQTEEVALYRRGKMGDVPTGFVMYVPVLIKFDEGEAIIWVLVRDETTEALVRLPAAPRDVTLNPLESVLAEVRTEGWSSNDR